MDLRKLKTLIDLVSESGISELEVTEGEGKVRIVKNMQPVYVQSPPAAYPSPVSAATPATFGTMGEAPPVAAEAPAIQGHVVKSPMVGTFYRAPSPGAEPFVQLGDAVKAGQTICIVEAMKLMNEIECDHTGVIKEILAENGQAVEYGQPLFVVG